MFKPLPVNPSLNQPAKLDCNYTIDINDANNTISLTNNTNCTLYNIHNFFTEDSKSVPKQKIQAADTIMYSKFARDSSLIISDFSYSVNVYTEQDPNSEYQLFHQFKPGTFRSFKNAISPNSKIIAAGAYSVLLYDIENKSIWKEMDNHMKYAYSLCFVDDQQLAVGSNTGSIGIFNIETATCTHKITEHCLTVRSWAHSQRNNYLFSASDDLHMNIIDLTTFKVVSPLIGHKNKIGSLVYNEDKGLLFSASFDGSIKIWDLKASNKCIATWGEGEGNMIWDIAVSKEGDKLVYTAENKWGAFSII